MTYMSKLANRSSAPTIAGQNVSLVESPHVVAAPPRTPWTKTISLVTLPDASCLQKCEKGIIDFPLLQLRERATSLSCMGLNTVESHLAIFIWPRDTSRIPDFASEGLDLTMLLDNC